jgi:hypothetical protein
MFLSYRVRGQPYEIEVCNPRQPQRERTETTISALAEINPTTTLVLHIYPTMIAISIYTFKIKHVFSLYLQNFLYKLRIKITEVVSLTDWMYMDCKICWKGLRMPDGSVQRCSVCPDGEPWPRYKSNYLLNRYIKSFFHM